MKFSAGFCVWYEIIKRERERDRERGNGFSFISFRFHLLRCDEARWNTIRIGNKSGRFGNSVPLFFLTERKFEIGGGACRRGSTNRRSPISVYLIDWQCSFGAVSVRFHRPGRAERGERSGCRTQQRKVAIFQRDFKADERAVPCCSSGSYRHRWTAHSARRMTSSCPPPSSEHSPITSMMIITVTLNTFRLISHKLQRWHIKKSGQLVQIIQIFI